MDGLPRAPIASIAVRVIGFVTHDESISECFEQAIS